MDCVIAPPDLFHCRAKQCLPHAQSLRFCVGSATPASKTPPGTARDFSVVLLHICKVSKTPVRQTPLIITAQSWRRNWPRRFALVGSSVDADARTEPCECPDLKLGSNPASRDFSVGLVSAALEQFLTRLSSWIKDGLHYANSYCGR